MSTIPVSTDDQDRRAEALAAPTSAPEPEAVAAPIPKPTARSLRFPSALDPAWAPSELFFSRAADVVYMSGADRLDFLQRMSTNRMVDLQPGESRGTCILNGTGRVVDAVTAYTDDSGTLLLTSAPGAATAVARHLRSHLVYGDDVRITDASDQVTLLRVVGRIAADTLARGIGVASSIVVGLEPGTWLKAEPEGKLAPEAWIFRPRPPTHARDSGERVPSYEVVLPTPAADVLADRLVAAGIHRGDRDDLARLRIATGAPAWGAEIDGRANPLELGLRDVIDFEKGCYIGQEVIARLETYDKLQRRLARIAWLPSLHGPNTDPGFSAAVALRPGDSVITRGAALPARGSRATGRLTTLALWASHEVGPGAAEEAARVGPSSPERRVEPRKRDSDETTSGPPRASEGAHQTRPQAILALALLPVAMLNVQTGEPAHDHTRGTDQPDSRAGAVANLECVGDRGRVPVVGAWI